MCSSPSCAVGAHNLSTAWLSQGGSTIYTRNKDSARRGPGPGDLRKRARQGVMLCGLGASGRLDSGRLPIRHSEPPPWQNKAGLKLCPCLRRKIRACILGSLSAMSAVLVMTAAIFRFVSRHVVDPKQTAVSFGSSPVFGLLFPSSGSKAVLQSLF